MKNQLMKKRIFIPILVLGITSIISLAGCSSGNVAPPDIADTWEPLTEIETLSPVSCEENRPLFAYDEEAPLDIKEVSRRREEGVTIIDLTYASPKDGRVPATLVVPDGEGPFAGMIYQHGMPANRQHLIPAAVTYARMGAVVILIDAPFNRPEHGDADVLTFTEQDRREQIQLIVDLRRAVDLLLSRSDVDSKRLAYVGISYGGAMGGLLAGVEDRLKGYVLQVGDGGLVTHFTGPEDMDWWLAKPEEVRQQWIAWMWPIEPIHYVGCASSAALLFQNGTLDAMVPPADALRYQEAGSEPKMILWYKDGHGLRVAAGRDQAEWLSKIIGIESHRPLPWALEIALTTWFLLTGGCLAFMVWDLWKKRPAPNGARLMWLLTTVFLGIFGLMIYWISARSLQDSGKTPKTRTSARRGLGSSAWAASGNVLGGIGVLALLLYFPQIFSAYLLMQIAATFILPFCAGWLISVISRWISHSDEMYERNYKRPLFVDVVSTCLVLVGLYPTVNILVGRWIDPLTAPFGFDIFYPPLWGALCLGALAGTLVAFLFHMWMIRRGLIRWGMEAIPEEFSTKDLAWYLKVALVVLSFAAMLGAIFLSMQIA